MIKKIIRDGLYKIFRPIILDVLMREFDVGEGTNGLNSKIMHIVNNNIYVWGDVKRLKLSPRSQMTNTLFNTSSGCIEIGDYTFSGHNVSIITGMHRYTSFLEERMRDFPKTGNDIKIGSGVWIGSNAVILGPCTVGDHAVIAAGAVVIEDVLPCSVVAGVPAKVIKKIDVPESLPITS